MALPKTKIEKKMSYHLECVSRCDEEINKIELQRVFHIAEWTKLKEELDKWD